MSRITGVRYFNAIRAASSAASKQWLGELGRDDRQRRLAVAPVHREEEVGLLGLGRQPGGRSAALHVDEEQRQLQADRQAEAFGLEVDARAAGRGHRGWPANAAPMATPTAAISSSACSVRTPKFLCRDSSWRMSDAGVIG